MNFIQFGMFFAYCLSVFFLGSYIYNILSGKNSALVMNKGVYLGETLLLGSIVLSGELLLLSFVGLYNTFCLWFVVLLNYGFLLCRSLRRQIREVLFIPLHLDLPRAAFIALVGILAFRNSYFMFDVDSISTYLFTQKLWLASGSSLTGGAGTDVRVFLPQFDNLPSSLGLSVFPQETLFPQLINLFWRLVVLLLVFGYASWRFGSYGGLAAVMFVIFDSHFFYSGANSWVLINSALIALLFCSAYNFWEGRARDSGFRFLLGLVFSAQLMANKYQMAYFYFFITTVAFFIQPDTAKRFSGMVKDKKYFFAFLAAFFIMLLWFLKNFLVTGLPSFPLLAGKTGAFGWSSEQGNIFVELFGGISPALFIKYMNYFFIWPGVNPAKYIALGMSFLPLLFLLDFVRKNKAKNGFIELCYWMGLCVLAVMSICLASHQDPRYYRYPIAIFSFSAVFLVHYICASLLNIKRGILIWPFVLLMALPGYKIIFQGGGSFNRPTINENIEVLFNRIHTDYAIRKHYPQVPFIISTIEKEKDKFEKAAWDMGKGVNFPAFFLPIKPQVSLWLTTLIKWDSYADESLISADLEKSGIEWVGTTRDEKFVFLPADEYASIAAKYERRPKKIFYDYNFPQELSVIRY